MRVFAVALACGLIGAALFAVVTYRRAAGAARQEARIAGQSLMTRTVETFMVSTRRYDQEFRQNADPAVRKRVLDDWNRTIAAVDTAVIHDFGAGTNRVRLIGDKDLVGYKPLGGDAVRVTIPFESEAIAKLRAGATSYEVEDGDILRLAAPLWSDAHAGCGSCHIATVEGLNADLSKRVLLGTLNVYVPMKQALAGARSEAAMNILWALLGVMAIVGVLANFMNWKVIQPIEAIAITLDEAAAQVDSGALQVSSSSQQLAQGASAQASAVEETSASLEELTSVARANQDRSQQAQQISADAKARMERSERYMNDLVLSIRDIQGASEETQKIVRTIDEIAFQTNILALNAAVEAARAGEAGAGFAVVADEVRNLAQRAAEAARSTAQLIEMTVSKIANGATLAEKMQAHSREVGVGSAKIAQLNAEIATASGEQSQGVDQIDNSVREIEKVVQQVAARTEEAAAASEVLTAQAASMKESVQSLRMLVR